MADSEQEAAPVALTQAQASTEAVVRKEAMVEEVLARLGWGEKVLAGARQFEIDPKTVRAWRVVVDEWQDTMRGPPQREARVRLGHLLDLCLSAAERGRRERNRNRDVP